jgi:hypothetical protein
LFSNKILSKELTEVYLDTHHTFDETHGYGCGIYKRLDDSVFGISGGDAGVGFESRHLVQEKVTVNILSNITEGGDGLHAILDLL